MIVLGMETSCDDTCASVVRDGKEILSNVVSSQEEIHKRYGGIVPEIASRQHDACAVPVFEEALRQAGTNLDEIEAIAVTSNPGLIGSLLVGVSLAKSLAFGRGLPFIGVSHLAGHLYGVFMGRSDGLCFEPHVGLVVSGGHTSLFAVDSPTERTLLGATLDDAAGEAFDKVAKFLGLSYPGGPPVERAAREWNGDLIPLPRPCLEERGFDFSFSGLKTAVINWVGKRRVRGEEISIPRIAASFQQAVGDVLAAKAIRAAEEGGRDLVTISGGVACNLFIREAVARASERAGLRVAWPQRCLCTDNAAMIAGVGFHYLSAGSRSGLDLSASARPV